MPVAGIAGTIAGAMTGIKTTDLMARPFEAGPTWGLSRSADTPSRTADPRRQIPWPVGASLTRERNTK
jgi:hypothetical protein